MSFSICVYMNPDRRLPDSADVLAYWESSRLHWVDELAKTGKFTQTRSDYFPTTFRGLASDLLPLLPPDRKTAMSLKFTAETLQERIDRCPADAVLGVDVWDLC